MPDQENKDRKPFEKNLESESTTPIQKKIEDEVEDIEKKFKASDLSTELSKERTHMSEHRTRMSEHRTQMSDHRTDLSEHRTDLSDKRTELSFQRTALSYERTLMSWIRTATSMISFGFTIYKFFQEVQKSAGGGRIFTPRLVGMFMIAFGLLGLLFAQIQHVIAYRKLKNDYPQIQKSLSSVLGMLVLVLGLVLFLAALYRQ
ncbi:MAG TPA: DUF202 domain-containing protein [Chitinophagaceae bacterium]